MVPILLAVAAIAGTTAASGQITSLATDHTGSVVVFSSAATLKGLDYGDDERIYEVTPANPPALLAQGPFRSLNSGYMWPAVSADGKVRVWTHEHRYTCEYCQFWQNYFAMMLDSSGANVYLGEGQAVVSRDGRWVSWGGGTGVNTVDLCWLDLRTGEKLLRPFRTVLQVPPGATGVSNDGGRVLWAEDGKGVRVVWPDGRLVTIRGDLRPVAATIEPGGRYAVVQDSGSYRPRIWIADLAAQEFRVLVEATEGAEQPQTTDDGALVGFISAADWVGSNSGLVPQFWLIDPVSGQLKQFTAESTGVRTAALSGDGRVVYLVNGRGELVRTTVDGERVVMLVSVPWPQIPARRTVHVPGTRSIMTGANLDEARVFIAGVEAKIVARGAGKIEYVTPEVGEQRGQIAEAVGPDGYFQPRRLWAEIRPVYVSLWTWADHWPSTPNWESGYAWALHGESRTLATPASPLAPGEWFEAQISGLRLEDAGPLAWAWSTDAGLLPLESAPPALDLEMEGLLRVKIRAPFFEPGAYVWIVPRGISPAGGAFLPVAQPAAAALRHHP